MTPLCPQLLVASGCTLCCSLPDIIVRTHRQNSTLSIYDTGTRAPLFTARVAEEPSSSRGTASCGIFLEGLNGQHLAFLSTRQLWKELPDSTPQHLLIQRADGHVYA